MATEFKNKCAILTQLWMEYRDDEEFQDFIEYNDMGLPLAFLLDGDVVKPNPIAYKYIDETFDLLLAALNIKEDIGFEGLDQMFDKAG